MYKLVKDIHQYDENYVYFLEPIKNNIMNNSEFIKIIYSDPLFALNGIYINININYTSVEKYYNKYKCYFNTLQYSELLKQIRNIEEGLLNKIGITNKTPQYSIYEQLKNGHIKIFSETSDKISNMFLLKIAGIWKTNNEYGLTYKFICC
jgi:hypothetical protein